MTTKDESTESIMAMISVRQAARRHGTTFHQQISAAALNSNALPVPTPMADAVPFKTGTTKRFKRQKSGKNDDFNELIITRMAA